MYIKERLSKLLESRLGWHLKQLIGNGLIFALFIGSYQIIFHEGPRMLREMGESRALAKYEAKREDEIKEIEKVIDEARYRELKVGYQLCKINAKSSGDLIDCISKLKKGSER
jgi:hypothetical protein